MKLSRIFPKLQRLEGVVQARFNSSSALPSIILDVSRWQGRMNWDTAKLRGILYGACRATVGDYYTDIELANNIAGMLAAEIPDTQYHVSKPSISYRSQMGHYYFTLGGRFPLWPTALDMELHDGKSQSVVSAVNHDCVKMIEDTEQRKPILYSNYNFITAYMGGPSWLADYDFWVANYTNASTPLVPEPWSSSALPWVIWQWSADGNGQGEYYGAQSDSIDLNRVSNLINFEERYLGGVVDPPTDPTLPEQVAQNTVDIAKLQDDMAGLIAAGADPELKDKVDILFSERS